MSQAPMWFGKIKSFGLNITSDYDILIYEDDRECHLRLEEATLSFNRNSGDNIQTSAALIESWASVPQNDAAVQSKNMNYSQLRFEVVSARTLEQNDKKHVAYTIKVCKDGANADPNPAYFERRYTDFLKLHDELKQQNPELMRGLNFPRKVLIGNFTPAVISTRSAGFETLLAHTTSHPKLRESPVLNDFLQGREIREARHCLDASLFDDARSLLENTFRLLNKLHTDRHPWVMVALCRLVACSVAGQPDTRALTYAELALRRFEGVSDADILPLYVPLLQTCIHLWWCLGRDKRPLEQRLTELKRNGMNVDHAPALSEIAWTENS